MPDHGWLCVYNKRPLCNLGPSGKKYKFEVTRIYVAYKMVPVVNLVVIFLKVGVKLL